VLDRRGQANDPKGGNVKKRPFQKASGASWKLEDVKGEAELLAL